VARVLHTADWQLGMTRHLLAGEAEARFRQTRIDVVARMAELAEERSCDAVVVAGDVFDTNQVDRTTLARALEALRRFTVPVLLLPANHDPLDAGSALASAAFADGCPDRVRVLTDTAPVRVADGLEVVGAPWTSKRPLVDLAAEAVSDLEPSGDAVRVLVAHGSVDVLAPDRNDPGQIRVADLESALADGRIHYAALGDRHSVTEIGDSGRIWYAGAPEPTASREQQPGYALVVDVDADECRVEPVPVGRWRFLRWERRVDGGEDIDALAADLDALDAKDCTVVELALTGTLTLVESQRLETVLDEAAARFAALARPARHDDVHIAPDDGDFTDLPLGGYAAAARDRLQEMAGGADERAATATDALGLLLRLSAETERRGDDQGHRA